eukprot:m.182009 g.182009  ORF g.182009 m.182009 type:complete len:62 (-) comp15521_c0_seq4:603-788(-)
MENSTPLKTTSITLIVALRLFMIYNYDVYCLFKASTTDSAVLEADGGFCPVITRPATQTLH